jgi:hypothetical protein
MLDSFQEGEYQFLDESVHELKENKKSKLYKDRVLYFRAYH